MKYIFLPINTLLVVIFINSYSFAMEKNDKYEEINRSFHSFNDSIDQNILKPSSEVYGLLPDFIEKGITNIISNLNEPSNFINHLFQGEINYSFSSLGRLAINSTIGIVGIFDFADRLGIKKSSTDFGQTLKSWGFSEGQYLVIPFIGPRSTRHFFGSIIDAGFNPVNYGVRDEDSIISISPSIIFILSSRSANSDAIDDLRNTSIDYYSSLKSIYLQSRGVYLSDDSEDDDEFFNDIFNDEEGIFPEAQK